MKTKINKDAAPFTSKEMRIIKDAKSFCGSEKSHRKNPICLALNKSGSKQQVVCLDYLNQFMRHPLAMLQIMRRADIATGFNDRMKLAARTPAQKRKDKRRRQYLAKKAAA